MAIARRGTAVTDGSTTTAAGPISVAAPTGISDGDLWVVFFNSAGNTTNVVSAPAGQGWVGAGDNPVQTTYRSYVFWKVWRTGDPTSASFSFAVSSQYSFVSIARSGVDTTTPVGAQDGTGVNSNTTTYTPPPIVQTVANSVSLLFVSVNSASSTFTASPGGWTADGDTGTGAGVHARDDDQQLATPAGTTVTPGNYGTSANSRHNGWHLELVPAVAAAAASPLFDNRRVARNSLLRR